MVAHRPSRLVRAAASALAVCALAAPSSALARDGKDARPEVRVTGVCAPGAGASLRLRADDGRLELRFRVAYGGGGAWRVALVRERRVVWKGVATAERGSGSFELRRTVEDLPGPDSVTARAWGPDGVSCRATATL